MNIRSADEVKEIILAYAKDILHEQKKKKEIDIAISEIKQDAKEDGIAISKVMKQLTKLKAISKLSDADILEEDTIMEMLESDETIQNDIAVLNS